VGPDDRCFDERTLIGTFSRFAGLGATGVADGILAAFTLRNREPRDDIAMLVARVVPRL
jgi:hypothetical protein